MSIQSSTIRIYSDSSKTTLVTYVNTSGSSTTIPVSSLPSGKTLYATAQIVDENSLQSDESAVYSFSTLPFVEWAEAQPLIAGEGYVAYQIDETTQDVTISRIGIAYSTTDSTLATYSVFTESEQGSGTMSGLPEHTTYYCAPYVRDSNGREWVNMDSIDDVTTPYAKPQVEFSGVIAVGSTTYARSVTITSSIALSEATLHCTDGNGTNITQNLSTTTGTQGFTLTGLNPNTQYTAYVTATNASGQTTSSSVTFTTTAAEISVALTLDDIDNTTNLVDMTSTITKDSSITLVSHGIWVYPNDTHTGSATTGGTQSTPADRYEMLNIAHLDEDETYYGFSKVEYTVSGDATTYTLWSSPVEIETYTLLSFGNITTDNTTATIPYSVAGTADSITVEYSADGTTWTSIPVSNLSGGTLSLTGLNPGTTYQLRGRARGGAGWQGYVTTTFTTTADAGTVVVTSVTNITPTSADVSITVS